MGCYAQLTQEQRYQIRGLMKAGFNQSEIALEAEVHRSTISREIRRNSGLRSYRPAQAHRMMQKRRREAVTGRISAEDWEMISRLIRFDLSPEQAAATVYQ